MRNKSRIFLLIYTILSLLLFACSSTKEVKRLPFFRFIDATLSKGVDVKGTTATPVEPSIIFSTEDPEIVAYLKLENLTGKHALRWEWYDPNGKLYYATKNYTIEASEGKYRKEVIAWHSLSIRGEKAANYPGDWQVKIYLDDKHLVASRDFKIEIDIDTPPGITQKPNPKKWGFIIGIEEYSNLPSVDYVEKDALIIKEYFVRILGVPEENIIFLINKRATKATIEGYLQSYIPLNVEKDTTLYVYFAGHGLPSIEEGKPEPYLAVYDSDIKTMKTTSYKLQSFYKDINNLNIERAFVFIDACFSGVASRSEKMLLAGTRPIFIEHSEGFFDKLISLTASSGGQITNSYPEKKHGLFSYFLLRGLRGEADINENGSINMEELYKYVKDNVIRVSRRKGMEQTPEIISLVNTLNDIEITKVLK